MELKIEDLSLEEKIGQMIIVGIDESKITERTRKLILKYKIGGIILYRKNFKSYEEMVKLIKDLKELNSQNKIPLFISIDQEGGRVNRMPKEFLNLPVANLIATKMGEVGVREAASIISEILSKAGFNMNFAPVLDLKRFDTKAIGDRSFCKDYKKVSKYGLIQINEYKAKNIIAVAKHFPGHGDASADSHLTLPMIDLLLEEMERTHIKPFANCAKNIEMVMIAHLHCTCFEKEVIPASLSKNAISYLRNKLGFDGITISDDMIMKGVAGFGNEKACEMGIRAGLNMFIYRNSTPETINIIETIAKKAEMDT